MTILTHGSDLSLSPTLTPVVRHTDGTVRGALDRLAQLQFHAVQLDATLSGIRPRELDRRARKDLTALLGRRGLQPSGIDLFVPRKHFLSSDTVDRAMTATLAGIELAADMGRLPISIALPIKDLPHDLADTILEAADGHGVKLAVHAEDQLDALQAWIERVDLPILGAAIDPAALMAQGDDPATIVQRLSRKLTVARLSDLQRGTSPTTSGSDGGQMVRCVAGSGDLDLMAYRIAVDLATSRTGPVVLDLRSLPQPLAAARVAAQTWDNAKIEF